MFSGLGSALVGGALGLIGGKSANEHSAASAEASMRFEKETMQNRYQWMFDDLKKAGINPMLAYAKTSAGASGAQYQAQNVGESAVRGASSGMQTSLMRREQRNRDMIAETQASQNTAQANYYDAQREDIDSKLDAQYWSAQTRLMGSSAREKDENVRLIGQQVWKASSEIALIQRNINLAEQKVKESESITEKNIATTNLQREQKRLARAEQRLQMAKAIGEEHGLPAKAIEAKYYKSEFAKKAGEYFRKPASELRKVIRGR